MRTEEAGIDAEALLLFLKQRHTGRRNAITSAALEALYQVRGAGIRRTINELRRMGQPICSDENGYYYAADEAELSATIRQLQSRISKIAVAKSGLVRATAQFSVNDQTSLPI